MKYLYEFKRDPLGYLRISLPKEISLFSDFIEDIPTTEEADEYLADIENVLNGTYKDSEIQLNATSVLIKKDMTVVEHFFRNDPPYENTIETEEFKELLLIWRDNISKDL
ncbi:tRNA-Val4 [Bacillus swezeyi]|uniref:tRNA-Val4 n=1 Tax=Bacillus swezeyi TaxID=1925020 RepID=A0A5M8RVZ9_9BACI|nr:tRNA-Val4 [Bacillus swezeyi]KAA6452049.1 tRNA-Val4 [Bacillus swezeyi]TYS36267.1 tRNA-Val4 [Bacillus swezeyi]